MLYQINDIAPDVISLFVSGRLSTQDYLNKLQPLLEKSYQDSGKVKLYMEADVLLEGWDVSSLTGGDKVQFPAFDALVFVGGPDWVGNAVNLLAPFMQGEVAWFPLEQKQQAQQWIAEI
ncbi:STAS/SEC14 domain-containing protein [Shewanella sp. WXL01]|uniref:STAS/SEC14 domain-containing protein n=1 Tax=Shewanella maritima TaxID=2520507 RepID=A0A411PH07_9GAMM|nr:MULTISPECIES: STAS/SEC14 domain-containing protein [Shewanella]NKF49224.1 STAS/SEC14 domain-containing protein [Shewanella sp. WXL01]QBF82662.1 STAS/SEC14 domain-containing protein [Shewanella maritima]